MWKIEALLTIFEAQIHEKFDVWQYIASSKITLPYRSPKLCIWKYIVRNSNSVIRKLSLVIRSVKP